MAEFIWLFIKRNHRMIKDIAVIIGLIWLSLWLADWIFRLATPIVFGIGIYLLIAPTVNLITKTKINKSTATAIALIGYFLLIASAVIIGTGIAAHQTHNLIEKMPTYAEKLQTNFGDDYKELISMYKELPYGLSDKINEKVGTFGEKGFKMMSAFLLTAAGTLGTSLVFLGNVLLGVLLAYFLGKDEEGLKSKIQEYAPNWAKEAWDFLSRNVISGIGKYIKAQLKLITITFAVIFVTLLMLGVKNAFVIALVSALFDILPLLGVATVFVPWIIYLLIVGNVSLAIKLGILYGAVFLLRQLLEPKLVGDSLGVSAFVMLSLMVIFLGLFGIWGMLLTPILTILLKELWEQGYFKRWIRVPEKQKEIKKVE